MRWKFWKKNITINDILSNRLVKNSSPYSVEAYIITTSGINRLKRENNPSLSYEAAQILQALKIDQHTIGEIADVCSHAYGPTLRKEIDNLVELGLITRYDRKL